MSKAPFFGLRKSPSKRGRSTRRAIWIIIRTLSIGTESTVWRRSEREKGIVTMLRLLASTVISRAWAMLPPAAPVITTPLLMVVGMTETRNSPILTAGSRGSDPMMKAAKGATAKMSTRAITAPLVSRSPARICSFLRIRPEQKKIVHMTASAAL